MDDIKDVTIGECNDSKYIKQRRMCYTQNGKKKTWDLLQVHDSVVILIFNKTRNVLVFVKQFRPAVYICNCELSTKDDTTFIDSGKFPGNLGVTLELCAGIVDKDKPYEQIAQEEVMEECGYHVPLENVRKVTSYRAGVGTSGSLQILYYVEVTDEMKVGKGSEIIDEGHCNYNIQLLTSMRAGVGTSGSLQILYYVEVTDEMKVGRGGGIDEEFIEIVEIPVSEGRAIIMDETILKPVGLMFGVTWFYSNIWKQGA